MNSNKNDSDAIEEEAAFAEEMKETESDLDRREWLRYQAERQRQKNLNSADAHTGSTANRNLSQNDAQNAHE